MHVLLYRNCEIGIDCMEHYVEECPKIYNWFRELGKDKEKIWKKLWSEELDSVKCSEVKNVEYYIQTGEQVYI